ncbi:MAG: DUF3305 domain-containing protein [Alphaproteobacteria bacterium]|nr:DUF3305 domain-containing protein [Alphaproteobacteria bacterium]
MDKHVVMPVGVIVQKRRIDHPWKEWTWEPVGVLPWAPEGISWQVLVEDAGRVQYHAATLPLELFRADTEAYVDNLNSSAPAIYVVVRPGDEENDEADIVPCLVTVSPYEAQDYLDSGEEIVERLGLPDILREWMEAFVAEHHEEEAFIKRKRDRVRVDRTEDGKGDPRVRQLSDVYRAPTSRKIH